MEFGPGLLESVYGVLLADDLVRRGFTVRRQVRIPAVLRGIEFNLVFVADLIVNDAVVVELKAAEKMEFVFERQLLTYLKVLNMRLGLLLNFGAPTMKQGIRRVVNGI